MLNSELLKLVIPSIATFILGYFLHLMVSRYNNKKIIQHSSRIIKSDIERAMKSIKLMKEHRILATDKLTMLKDWKVELSNISQGIDDIESQQLFDYFCLIEELTGYQEEYISYLEKQGVKSQRYDDVKTARIITAFIDTLEKVIALDISQVQKRLEVLSYID